MGSGVQDSVRNVFRTRGFRKPVTGDSASSSDRFKAVALESGTEGGFRV